MCAIFRQYSHHCWSHSHSLAAIPFDSIARLLHASIAEAELLLLSLSWLSSGVVHGPTKQ
jgi:hypothetical protein